MRKARVKINYEGKEITADIGSYLVSFSYSDPASGKADGIDLTLEDREAWWKESWFPEEGSKIKAEIVCENWKSEGDLQVLKCGTFSLDEVSFSGPPDTATLRGVSARISTALRREKKTKAWENISLSSIASDIAKKHGLQVMFQGEAGESYERQDQRNESDLAFIKRLAKDKGLNVKTVDNKIVLFSGKKYDAKKGVFSVERGKDVVSYNFKTKAHDIFKAAKVSYWGPDKKKVFDYTFTPPNAPKVGQTLNITKRCESAEDAERRAEAELRAKNKNRTTGSLTMLGSPAARAGLNFNLKGFGIFDGKYAIEEAKHTLNSSGYKTSLNMRKTLEW